MYGRQKVVNANVFPVMVPIYDVRLTTTQASIDISNIPQNYAHLKLVMSGMRLSAGAQIYMAVNGDATAANYLAGYRLFGDGTSVTTDKSFVGATIGGLVYGDVSSTGDTAGRHTFGETLITDYTNTSIHKSWLTQEFNTSGVRIMSTASLWASTVAVSRLTLTPNSSGLFAAGTRATLYGLGVIAPSSPGSVLPVTYATTLPASPLDGQEAILVDNTTTPTYQWRFRYNANSANTNKWEFIGGVEGSNTNPNTESYALATVGNTATVGPQFVVPRAGLYRVTLIFAAAPSVSGTRSFINLKVGAAAAVACGEGTATDTSGRPVHTNTVDFACAAGDTLLMQVQNSSTNSVSWSNRTLLVEPIRVS
jgi:hypothetical protein